MKRIVSLILALSMVLSMFTMSFAGTSLKDVEGTKYEAAVEALVELGVVSGYPDGTYLPNNVVTRAELAKLLVVAYGLEPAAEASKGVTPFADVNAVSNHWASGYVNVSADYKFVNGYPDGSFKADSTVTYAEAITMCLRVLGYANEIDSKGTWPTNYIAKAQDLKLMKDIEFSSYNDGAKRGDIAILIWNMLRTKMWTVESESEGDGLVSAPNKLMLNVKFADYHYDENDVFEGWSYNASEEKVYVELANAGNLVYDKNDFYTIVPGTEVSVLTKDEDKKDDVLLSLTINEDNVLVDGSALDLDDKYEQYEPERGVTYSYLLLASNKKSSNISGELDFNGANSEYVLKVEDRSNYTRIKTTAETRSIDEDEETDNLVIFGDERLSLVDLKVGDVITKIASNVYVLSRTTESGTFNSLTYEKDEEKARDFVELDDEEYDVLEGVLTVAKVNEKDEEEFDDVDVEKVAEKKNPYAGEDATLYLNFLGEVVRMEFGVVKTKVDGDFFMAPTGETWSVADEDGAVWYVKLANEDGEKSYQFDDGKQDDVKFAPGKCYWVVFNDDDQIKDNVEISELAELDEERKKEIGFEDFDMDSFSGEEIDVDTKYIGDGDKKKVTASTKVFTVRAVEDDDGNPRTDKFELTVTDGSEELEGVTSGILAKEKDTIRVTHAFVEGESTSDRKDFGIVEKITIKEEKAYITVNGTKYEQIGNNETPDQGSIILYTIDSKDRIKVAFEYKVTEVENAQRVTKVDDTLLTLKNGRVVDTDLLSVEEPYKDYRAFNIVVRYDSNDNPIFDSVEEVELDSIVAKKDYGVAENTANEVIAIIDGIDWPTEEEQGA